MSENVIDITTVGRISESREDFPDVSIVDVAPEPRQTDSGNGVTAEEILEKQRGQDRCNNCFKWKKGPVRDTKIRSDISASLTSIVRFSHASPAYEIVVQTHATWSLERRNDTVSLFVTILTPGSTLCGLDYQHCQHNSLNKPLPPLLPLPHHHQRFRLETEPSIFHPLN
jgi:hypothetical protein